MGEKKKSTTPDGVDEDRRRIGKMQHVFLVGAKSLGAYGGYYLYCA